MLYGTVAGARGENVVTTVLQSRVYVDYGVLRRAFSATVCCCAPCARAVKGTYSAHILQSLRG